MAYPYYQYPYQQQFSQPFGQPVQDQLNQLRQPYQQQIQPQQNQDERIWVQGIESAKAYLVAPNGFVRLWDSMSPCFFEKRADATGKPYMEVYEYTRKSAEAPNPTVVNTTTAPDYTAQIKALEWRIEALEKRGVQNDQPNADD